MASQQPQQQQQQNAESPINVQRFLDMRAEMLAVFAFAVRPNNNDNANGNTTNGVIRGGRDADTMNASTIPKPGVVPRYSISSSS